MARLRPRRPVVAIVHHDSVARRLALEWGVVPARHTRVRRRRGVVERVARSGPRHGGHIEQGDRVVITAGTHVNVPGSTNVIKVEVAS